MTNRWVNGREILKRWDAQPFELLNAFKNGLPPHLRKTGEILVYEGPLRPAIKVIRDDKKVWRDKSPLGSPYNSRSYLITDDSWLKILLDWRLVSFVLSDVKEFEKIHGIVVKKKRWLSSTYPNFNAENSAIAEGLSADTTINSEEYFPELNIHLLKMQAERWVKKFSEAPIKRILLYNYSSKYEGTMIARNGLPPHPAIYAIVFDVDVIDKTTNMSAEDRLQYDLMGVRGERQQESYERLLVAIKPNKRIEDNEQYYDLMTKDFAKVYKNPPKHDYREEWQFYCIFKNTYNKTPLTGNVRTDEPHIVLWQQDWREKIQEWVDEARKTEHIDILKLCHVLAYDVESSAKLTALWRKYQLDERGPSIPETETFEKRAGAWSMLMQRLTTGFDGVPDQGKVPYLKTCKEDRDKGIYVEAPKNEGTHVNLQTLNDYFTKTLFVPTPLPQPLLPVAPTYSTLDKNDKKCSAIKTPPGTKWQQIRIDLVHEGLIKITHPQGEITTTRDGLGLGGKKKTQWKEFEEFAVNKGYYGFPPGVDRDKLKNKKYRLKNILQNLFPKVEGEPIVYHKRKYDEDLKMWFEEKYQSILFITKTDIDLMKKSSDEDAIASDEDEIAKEFRGYENSESIF